MKGSMTKLFAASICIVVALLFMPLSFAQQAAPLQDFEKGSDLFHNCQGSVRALDSSDGGSAADLELAEQCSAYVQGFIDGFALQSTSTLYSGDATVGTIIRVYVAYMQRNPKWLDDFKPIGLYIALRTTYPCPKRAK
jgi:Rap1a immunity proteins